MSLSATNSQTHNISDSRGTHNVNKGYLLPLNIGRAYSTSNFSKRKQKRSTRRSTSTTSSALALLAFLFFLNILQRSLDESKQGPVLMTRITKQTKIRPRNDFIEDKQSTIETTTLDNIMVLSSKVIKFNPLFGFLISLFYSIVTTQTYILLSR